MRVRHVCAGDRTHWLQMRCELWPSADAETHAVEIDRFFAGDSQDPSAVLVAEDSSGAAVGLIELSIRSYAEGCVTDRVGYVEGWYVKPSSQRRGIGRALIEEAEHWASAQGCTELGSDAEIENEPGILAHRHVGFEETGRIVCFRKSLSKTAIQTVTPPAARRPVSPRRHGGHGDFTEASGFSVHLRVLRVSVVNKVLEFLSSLASRNSPGS